MWIWIGAVTIGAVALYGWHRLATWADRRGWIYYRSQDRPRPGGLGMVGQIFHPALEHTIEERRSNRLERDRSGEPGPTGGEDRTGSMQ